MPETSTTDVTTWLGLIQPDRQPSDWPPMTRALEEDADIVCSLDRLLEAVNGFGDNDARLNDLLANTAVADEIRRLLAHVGSARLVRIISALTDRLSPDRVAGVLAMLRHPRTPEGRTVDAALNANARITLRGRLVAQQRLDVLRYALDHDQETTR